MVIILQELNVYVFLQVILCRLYNVGTLQSLLPGLLYCYPEYYAVMQISGIQNMDLRVCR